MCPGPLVLHRGTTLGQARKGVAMAERRRRVLLKISGEAFGGGSLGVNPDVVAQIAREIAEGAKKAKKSLRRL